MMSTLGETIAKRTSEESGDYVVEPFVLTTEQIVGNTDFTGLAIGKGIAYNKGQRFENPGTLRTGIPKAKESINVASQTVSINFGNHVEVNELVGEFGSETNDMVLILDTAQDAVTNQITAIAAANSLFANVTANSAVVGLSLIHI